MMTTFDLSDTTNPCGQRDATTVPMQSLTLLNNPFVHEQSKLLAQSANAQSKDSREQIQILWSSIYKRSASRAEIRLAENHLKEQRSLLAKDQREVNDASMRRVEALSSLAHVLLNSNEFLYVD